MTNPALPHSTDWESRFQAIVSNTPGLVLHCHRDAAGRLHFPYLSEGCHALLGVSPQQLQANPEYFHELLLPEDRVSFDNSMLASTTTGKSWNWEGRIRIAQWNDIKWINLRCTPRPSTGEGMQWDGIMSNITQSKLEEAEIKRSRTQLSELSAHVEKVKEEERTRISREIHDDLGGNLTAIKMALALLAKRLPDNASAELHDRAQYLDTLVDRTLESIHRIAGDLRPGVLDFGITAAIEWQAGEFEKQTGIPCTLQLDAAEISLPPDQSTALFRIFQEALTNISKHAEASQVEVRMTRQPEDHTLLLEITDNGKGLAANDQTKSHSFGIRGMKERAHALGGKLSLHSLKQSFSDVQNTTPNNAQSSQLSNSPSGCVVSIHIPLLPA